MSTNQTPANQTHRYLVALPRGNGNVFLAWRLLSSDRTEVGFDVQRRKKGGQWQTINDASISDSTNYFDTTAGSDVYEYRVLDIDNNTVSEVIEADGSDGPSVVAMDVPINPDEKVTGIVVGDLRNDKQMGYVLRSVRGNTVWFSAYSHKGEALWEIDTHLPARGGWNGSTNHVPFLCWDINGDGRSEVVFHSFKGDYPAEEYDKAKEGELLTAVDGETGEVVWNQPWPAVCSRVMMTVGHLRGIDKPASVVVLDETYGDVVLTAVDGTNGETQWRIEQKRPAGHNLDIADIDGDGVQEVICGGICYNGDGTKRWEAEEFGHTDISKPAKIDPSRDGLQIWYAVESNNPGIYFVDKDGKTIFKESFHHAHYGWIARHTSELPGFQPHTAEDGRRITEEDESTHVTHFPIYLPDGSRWLNLTNWQRKNFIPIHWDETPEVAFIIRKDNKRVVRLKKDGSIEDLPNSKLPEQLNYGRNLGCIDVMGDFRENIVIADNQNHRLLVLMNPNVATHRGCSPCDHFEYLHDRSQFGSGYYIYLSPPDTIL